MPILDILDEDAFKNIKPYISQQTEINFYRGAPPQWLNFYLDEKNKDEDRFIKRDGYDELRKQIEEKFEEITYVNLNHKPGSGGTTLAMQLLWDLRESYKCAVLVDLESSLIATAVIDLYAAGESHDHKPVLLLVQDGNLNTLHKSFVAELSERKIESDKPIVIILNCVRMDNINDKHSKEKKDEVVNIVDKLSVNEVEHFKRKNKWLLHKYTNEHGLPSIPGIIPVFHGFNIMQSDFSQDYVKRAWDASRPPVTNQGLKFTACLCLLNCYVPGSFVLKTDWEKFLKTDTDDSSFEQKMGPFLHLMVSFNPNGSGGQQVLRMAHPMIAKQGTQILHDDAVIKKNDMAQILLQELFTGDHSLLLSRFIKELLTKRENNGLGKDCWAPKFSRLIMDIKIFTLNDQNACLLVLKEAVKKCPKVANYPQTLSRFYYLVNQDYISAKKWALKAKQISPHNSFIADTLGEVYKHHLNSVLKSNPNSLNEALNLATKALEAFNAGEILAEKEQENRDALTIFNIRPKIAYLQVANQLFGCKRVIESVAKRANQYPKHEHLISDLPNQIEKRAKFINMLLSYTQKSSKEKDPDYIWREARECYEYYIGERLQEGLGTGDTERQLRLLHENWPNDAQKTGLNLKSKVEDLKSSFQETYEKYFRSRYLLPLLYLETSDGTKVRVGGVVRCYKAYTTVGDEEIQLDVDHVQQLALRRSGTVTFELGFTIRGPTAYDIQFQD